MKKPTNTTEAVSQGYVTFPEALEDLGIGNSTLRGWAERGLVRTVKLRRNQWVHLGEAQEHYRQHFLQDQAEMARKLSGSKSSTPSLEEIKRVVRETVIEALREYFK